MLRKKDESKELANVDERPLARNLWLDPWDEFDRMVNEMFGRRWVAPHMGRAFNLMGTPNVDITDEGDHVMIMADMPGVPKETVKVEVDNGMLELSANLDEERKDEGKDYVRRERRCSSFYRSFALSEDFDGENVSASMKDGVLRVKVPRKEGKKTRKVEVKVD